VYEPYEAQHLDWYIDQIGENIYSTTSSAEISHWNNKVELEINRYVQLEHELYYAVRKNEAGDLELYEEQIRQPAPGDARRQASPIQPFVDAPEALREARILHTEALRYAGSTDIKRWGDAASHYESWCERGKLLAHFVRPGERVFEFGAGNSVVGEALPSDCSYVGSDAVPLVADVMKFDLNAPSLPQLPGHDVGLLSGVVEYVHDLRRLVFYLAQNFRTVVCSYAARTSSSSEEIARRRYSGWFNDLSEAEFCALFRIAGFRLSRDGKWAVQTLFRWDQNHETT
jgi:hypothetical protein